MSQSPELTHHFLYDLYCSDRLPLSHSTPMLHETVGYVIRTRESLLKGKTQYCCPSCTNYLRSAQKIYISFLQNKLSLRGGQSYRALPFRKGSLLERSQSPVAAHFHYDETFPIGLEHCIQKREFSWSRSILV